MLRGIYTSVSSMLNLQERQSVLTNNMANLKTNGYKEDKLISKSFDEMTLSNNDNYKNGVPTNQVLGGLSFGTKIDEINTNFKQGTFSQTENNSDFALNGSGFFQVRDYEGNIFYSRDGSFKVNSQGYLVTNGGHQVMGINQSTGSTEPINVGNGKMTMTPSNELVIEGGNSYKFSIVDFNDYKKLKKVGDNLYSGNNPINTNNYSIKQGYVEGSNVDYISAMAEGMETIKEFEANQKVIQTIDSTLKQIANEIGSVR
ncbi:MAG: flagellar hook-basal body complex protein [Paraclostridium sp.]|uniref:flagellar hook-basal body complex protein n=1 Tax=Paraclostridium sp. TaxID=2023273 RepID=UPI003F3A0CDB